MSYALIDLLTNGSTSFLPHHQIVAEKNVLKFSSDEELRE